jgi:hypothetical protein
MQRGSGQFNGRYWLNEVIQSAAGYKLEKYPGQEDEFIWVGLQADYIPINGDL